MEGLHMVNQVFVIIYAIGGWASAAELQSHRRLALGNLVRCRRERRESSTSRPGESPMVSWLCGAAEPSAQFCTRRRYGLLSLLLFWSFFFLLSSLHSNPFFFILVVSESRRLDVVSPFLLWQPDGICHSHTQRWES